MKVKGVPDRAVFGATNKPTRAVTIFTTMTFAQVTRRLICAAIVLASAPRERSIDTYDMYLYLGQLINFPGRVLHIHPPQVDYLNSSDYLFSSFRI